jgi:hypothetical protein
VNFQQIKVAVKMAEFSILKKHPTPTLLSRLELVTRHEKTLENFLSRSRSSPGGAFCSVISNTCCTSTVVFIIISYGCSRHLTIQGKEIALRNISGIGFAQSIRPEDRQIHQEGGKSGRKMQGNPGHHQT